MPGQFPSIIDLTTTSNGIKGFRRDGKVAGDNQGSKLAAKKGVIAASAPYASSGGTQRGEVEVYYSSPTMGISGAITPNCTIPGIVNSGRLGTGLTLLWDVRGNNLTTLGMGAAFAPGGGSLRGTSYFPELGSGFCPTGQFNLSTLNGSNGYSGNGEVNSHFFGYEIVGGDLSGNGRDEILDSSPNANVGARSNAGILNVIADSPTLGSSGTFTLSTMTAAQVSKIQGAATSAQAGISSALVANFQGNGRGLLVGSPGLNTADYLPASSVVGTSPVDLLSGSIAGRVKFTTSISGEGLGLAAASGSFRGTSFSDIAIGAPAGSGSGRVVVEYGSATAGQGGTVDTTVVDASKRCILRGGTFTTTGKSLAALDWNGDKNIDLAVGSNGQTSLLLGPLQCPTGEINLDSLDGIGVNLNGDLLSAQCGSSVANLGPIRTNLTDALGIGCPGDSPGSRTGAGSWRAVFGDIVPQITGQNFVINQGQALTLTSSNLAIADADTAPSDITITASSVTNGQFERISAPGAQITTFTYQEVLDGNKIRFIPSGSSTPSFQLKANSIFGFDGPYPATIDFDVAPVLTNHGLTVNQGETVTVTSSMITAVDSDTPASSLTLTISNPSRGYFAKISAPTTPITTFNYQEVLDSQIRFVHDGSTNAPNFNITVGDGRITSSAYSASVDFDAAPVLGNHSLTLNQGETRVLTTSDLSATDPDNLPSQLTFNFSNPLHIWIERVSAPGIGISSCTLTEVQNGDIRAVHDGTANAPSISIAVTDGRMTTTATGMIFDFAAAPVIINKTLPVNQGQSFTVTTAHISIQDSDTLPSGLTVSFNNVQNGRFERISAPGTPISNCTYQDIVDGNKIRFVPNGSAAPTVDLSVTDGRNIVNTAAIIDFDAAPVLTNHGLTVNQGETVTVTSSMITAVDSDTSASNLTLTVSNVSRGYFAKTSAPTTPITTFNYQEVLDSQIRFVHDGSTNAPNFNITVGDGRITSSAYSASVDFDAAPVLGNHSLTLNQGETRVLTTSDLSATDPDNLPSQLTFNFSNPLHIRIERVSAPGLPISSCTLTEVQNGDIRAVHDGTAIAPSINVNVTDGRMTTTATGIVFDFAAAPVIVTKTLPVNQGQPVTITTSQISIQDSDTSASGITVSFNNVQNGQFERISAPGTPISNCTYQDIVGGNKIRFVPNGSSAPTVDLSVTDGRNVVNAAATVTFNRAPQISVCSFDVNQSGSVIVTSQPPTATTAQIEIQDPDTAPSSINIHISNIQYGQFERASNPGVAITDFTYQDVLDQTIRFKQDGTRNKPQFDVTINDGGLPVSRSANVTFTPSNRAPTLDRNQINVDAKEAITLTSAELSASDPDGDEVTYTMTNLQNAKFIYKPAGTEVTTFTQTQINSGQIGFEAGTNKPSFSITLSDGKTTTAAVPAVVNFNTPPQIVNAGASVDPNSDNDMRDRLLALDAESPPEDLRWLLNFNVRRENGYFHYLGQNEDIEEFLQAEVDEGRVKYRQIGDIAPFVNASVRDGGGLVAGPTPLRISMNSAVNGAGGQSTAESGLTGSQIGGIIISACFLGGYIIKQLVKKWVNHRDVKAKQEEYDQTYVLPIFNAISEHLSTKNWCGYRSTPTFNAYKAAIKVLIAKLREQNIQVKKVFKEDEDKHAFLATVANTIKQFVYATHCCHPKLLDSGFIRRFYEAGVSPADISNNAQLFAQQIAASWRKGDTLSLEKVTVEVDKLSEGSNGATAGVVSSTPMYDRKRSDSGSSRDEDADKKDGRESMELGNLRREGEVEGVESAAASSKKQSKEKQKRKATANA